MPVLATLTHPTSTTPMLIYGTDGSPASAGVRDSRGHQAGLEQAAKFEFVLNLKAAKAIGIELPTATLLRADEVMK